MPRINSGVIRFHLEECTVIASILVFRRNSRTRVREILIGDRQGKVLLLRGVDEMTLLKLPHAQSGLSSIVREGKRRCYNANGARVYFEFDKERREWYVWPVEYTEF